MAPSMNFTVPVGDPGVTIAVSETACPTKLGFLLEESVVVVGVLPLTTCVSCGEVLPVLFASPP